MSMLINSENGKITNLMLSGEELGAIKQALIIYSYNKDEWNDAYKKETNGEIYWSKSFVQETIEKIILYKG